MFSPDVAHFSMSSIVVLLEHMLVTKKLHNSQFYESVH